MSRPQVALPTLLAAGAIGAAAATALQATWRWYHQQQQQVIGNDGLSVTLSLPSTSPSTSMCGACATDHLSLPHRPSISHSGRRFEGSVSRLGSDASYLEENEYEGDRYYTLDAMDEEEEARRTVFGAEDGGGEEGTLYMCPHCSNFLNASELIRTSAFDDDTADADESSHQLAENARILSAAEQLSIHLALKESLLKIFQSVDEDSDGLITREELADFLKKLGLTGDREQAFLNIIGDEAVQDFKQFFRCFQDTLDILDHGEEITSPDTAAAAAAASSEDEQTNKSTSPPNTTTSSEIVDTAATRTTSLPSSPLRGAIGSRNSLTVNTLTSNAALANSVANTPNRAGPGHAHHSSASSSLNTPTLLSPSSAGVSSPAIRVFLGGACGATTWRQVEAIPQLQAAGITFYNPQVQNWSEKLVALEGLMKAWCRILFFVISAKTRALASMIEVGALIAAGRRVVLVIEPVEPGVEIEGQVPSASELKDLNRARDYLRDVAAQYNVPVHPTADAGIKAIIALEEEERRERLRLAREGSATRTTSIVGTHTRRGRGSVLSSQSSPLAYASPSHKKAASSSGAAATHPPPNPHAHHSASSSWHPPHHPVLAHTASLPTTLSHASSHAHSSSPPATTISPDSA